MPNIQRFGGGAIKKDFAYEEIGRATYSASFTHNKDLDKYAYIIVLMGYTNGLYEDRKTSWYNAITPDEFRSGISLHCWDGGGSTVSASYSNETTINTSNGSGHFSVVLGAYLI